ncbi:MAG: hypothetical protein WGN25_10440 [Candidatus Electrothrix sp. GW3-4]|uniref:hypothetical protein n=1 Tax=Candidatus Electrothrix sp. GW3-4 TaxID=3126740 RepID=UPI0030CD8A95
MTDYSCTRYLIDRTNRIESVDEAWFYFASQNGGEELMSDMVLSRDISSFISCGSCQELYDMLITSVRVNRKAIEFPFRCDSPEKRRYMKMEMAPQDKGKIVFTSYLEREEVRTPVFFLESSVQRSQKIITICSWCKCIRKDDASWVDVEEAVEKMVLFTRDQLPKLSHGICPVCYERLIQKIS